MCDYAKCRQCAAIYEKTPFNKFLSRYSKSILGRQPLCEDCLRLMTENKPAEKPKLFDSYMPQSEHRNA